MTTKMLSYRQMHEEFGFTMGTLYGMVHQKTIPHFRLSKRWVMFDREEIEAWLLAKKIHTAEDRGVRAAGVDHDC